MPLMLDKSPLGCLSSSRRIESWSLRSCRSENPSLEHSMQPRDTITTDRASKLMGGDVC